MSNSKRITVLMLFFAIGVKAMKKVVLEGLVGFARRYMVPVPEAQSLSELNENIFARCLAYGNHKIAGRDKTVNELYEQEKAFLICCPEVPFANPFQK